MSDGSLNYALRLSNSGFLGPLGSAGSGLVSFGGRAAALLGPLAGLTGGVGALAIAIKSLDKAGQMEQFEVGVKNILGTREAAVALRNDLEEFANVTPFTFMEDVAPAARMLLNGGVAAADMRGELLALGNVASGAGKDLMQVTEIYAKALNRGKVDAEILDSFRVALVPIDQMLSDIFKVPKEDISRLASEGLISADVLRAGFQGLAGAAGSWGQMMADQSLTNKGLLSTLKGIIDSVMVSFGQPINDALAPIIQDSISGIGNLKDEIASIGEAAGVGITRIYAAASNGQLGALAEAELKYAGAAFLNYIGDNLNKAFNGIAPVGNFLGDALESAGTIFEGSLLKAASSFAAEFSGAIIEPVASALDFVGATGKAADLRFTARFAASQNGFSQAGEAATQTGKGAISTALDALARGMAGGDVVGKATLDELKVNRDTLRTKLDKLADDAEKGRKEAPTAPPATLTDETNKKIGDAVAKAVTTATTGSSSGSALGANVGFGGGLTEAMGGDFGQSTTRGGVLNAQDSQRARFNRLSKADQAKSFGEFSEFRAGESNPLSFLRGTRINSIGDSNLLDKRFESDALAKGSRLAGEAVAGTVNPASRAVGKRAQEAAAKPENRDLASILRKIEEHTAKFAEIAVG